MSFTNYTEEKILGHVFGGVPYTAATTLYIGLFTSASTDTTPGTEVAGSGYARVAVDPADLTVTPGEPTQIINDNAIDFPDATGGGWGTITHTGIFDAPTGGNYLYHGPNAVSKIINSGDSFRFPAGNFKITLD